MKTETQLTEPTQAGARAAGGLTQRQEEQPVREKGAKSGTSKAAAAAGKVAIFIETYLANGCNGARAYQAAGFRAKNVHVAAVMANRLLRKPDVARVIEERRAEALAKAKATADEVLSNMTAAMRFDPRKLVHQDGKLKALHELDDDTAMAINSIEFDAIQSVDEGGKPHLKVIAGVKARGDKSTARDQLAKHFGLYKADNQQKPPAVLLPGVRTVKFEPFKGRKVERKA